VLYHNRVTNTDYAGGNITSIKDNKQAVTYPSAATFQQQSYGYDALNRLTSATVTGTTGEGGYTQQSYVYSATSGNLTSKDGQTLGYRTSSITCRGMQVLQTHAAVSMGSNTYDYDCNGNQTQRVVGGVTYTLGYDAENRLVSVTATNLSATFTYDGDGNRVKTSITMGGTTTRIAYIGGHPEWNYDAGVPLTRYYFAGAQRIAVRANNMVSYLLGDHLGSTIITMRTDGNWRVCWVSQKPLNPTYNCASHNC
jgi:YD repeat-containing protein